MDLVVENQIGVTKDTELAEVTKELWKDEGQEVGWYKAAARQAQREGLPWIAEIFEAIARDEAAHSARFAELNGEISTRTAENVRKAIEGEVEANRVKWEAFEKARELGLVEAAGVFSESARDEARHARALMGIFKQK